MNRVLLLLHLVAVIIWIGGMFFAHVCLRPVAATQLQPPQRLPLLAAVLERFFAAVGLALVLLWSSGIILFSQSDTAAPWNWRVMVSVAAVMSILFGVILGRFNRMNSSLASQSWLAAGAEMDAIRKLVATNLVLGFCNVAVAVLGS